MHQSYIVRVYRHAKDNPRILVGTVENIDSKGKEAFTNIDELWEIVNNGVGHGRKTDKAKGKSERE